MQSERANITVEVGLNESVLQSEHPHIPVQREEVVRDILACARAGAAVIHYHARNSDGTNAWLDDTFYRDVMDAVAAESSVLTYPTYIGGDFAAIWRLADHPGIVSQLAIAPFDVMQNVGIMMWDVVHQCFVGPSPNPGDGDGPIPRPQPLEEMAQRNLRPTVAVFDVGEARWVNLAVAAGFLSEPVNLKLFLCQTLVKGPEPTPAAIDMYRSQLDAGLDVDVTVVPFHMSEPESCELLLDAALERSLNVRVGIGDNPRAYPRATNAELVERVVEKIMRYGFVPATPDDVVSRLSVKDRV
jgi:uncharacterized protein (DUF849 family)